MPKNAPADAPKARAAERKHFSRATCHVRSGSLCKVRDYAKGGVVRLASRCPMAARHRLALVIIAGSAVRRLGFQVYIGARGLCAGPRCWAGVSLVRRQAGAELNMSPHGTCTRPR